MNGGETPLRSFRAGAEWDEAQRIAKKRGDNLSLILRDRLREYIEDSQEEGPAMTQEVIPVEAVEAAARTLHDGGEQSWLAWDDTGKFGQDAYKHQARTILEAAAPHMLAEAWDEGYDAPGVGQAKYENPYR